MPGTIERLSPNDLDIEVVLRDADGRESVQAGELVINCTGPESRISRTAMPLFNNLLRKGLLSSDELDMGVQVDDEFAVINSDGQRSELLFAIGPLLRGSLWETTGCPRAARPSDACSRKPLGTRTHRCA